MREKTKAERGQTVQVDFPRDNSSHKLPNAMTSSFGGGVDNLSHSFSGTNARSRQDGTGKDKKDRFS